MSTTQKTRFITPPNKLKAKVGGGGIPRERVVKSQQYMNNNDIDFTPYASQFINDVKNSIEKIKESQNTKNKFLLQSAIMQLKANGGMFKYDLITHVANTCLQFVEGIEEINSDSEEVINAHLKTIAIITHNKMTGNCGTEGKALVAELERACERYFHKYSE